MKGQHHGDNGSLILQRKMNQELGFDLMMSEPKDLIPIDQENDDHQWPLLKMLILLQLMMLVKNHNLLQGQGLVHKM